MRLEDIRPVASRSWLRTFATLCVLTFGALLIHGYHPCAEDAAIYIPGIKKLLHPALYPFGSEFFLSHARMTLFDEFVAGSIKLAHIPTDAGLFLLYLLSIFLLLRSCWSLARHLSADDADCWTSVALIAALLTIPAAGTSLLVADPYMTPRSFSTPAALFALSAVLGRRYLAAIFWLLAASAFHPLMVVYGTALCGALLLLQSGVLQRMWSRIRNRSRVEQPVAVRMWAAAAALPLLSLKLHPATGAYMEALQTRGYFLVTNWTWYEWVGVIVPLAILIVVACFPPKRGLPSLRSLCLGCVCCGAMFTLVALVLASSPRFESLLELQPMRIFHPLYILFFLVIGVTLRNVIRGKAVRYVLLFAPVCAAMYFAQRETFPGNRHIEWPGLKPANRWLQTFAWIRKNTPQSAVFALNPQHMHLAGEDNQGFRALAERSMLADSSKDTGVVTMFPSLAATWKEQTTAQRGWEYFRISDFQRLARSYGVSWVVLDTSDTKGLECPYRNGSLMVCRIPSPAGEMSAREDLAQRSPPSTQAE